MSWWTRILRWATPAPALPPRPAKEDLRTSHAPNRILADAWQHYLERQVAQLEAAVSDLSVELALNELGYD